MCCPFSVRILILSGGTETNKIVDITKEVENYLFCLKSIREDEFQGYWTTGKKSNSSIKYRDRHGKKVKVSRRLSGNSAAAGCSTLNLFFEPFNFEIYRL